MSKKKKISFCFYYEWYTLVNELHKTDHGLNVILAIIEYAENGTMPQNLSGMENMAFNVMKKRIDNDTVKYYETCEKNSANANKRWNKEKNDCTQTQTNESESMRTHTNNTDLDLDLDLDLEKDKEKDIKINNLNNYGYYGNITLSLDEYNELVKEFGDSETNKKIDQLSIYCHDNNKKYKNYYMGVRNTKITPYGHKIVQDWNIIPLNTEDNEEDNEEDRQELINEISRMYEDQDAF